MNGTFVVTRNQDSEGELEPEVRVKKVKLALRITSDLLPPLPPSPDSSSEDPPYKRTPPTRPSVPPPVCHIPPPAIVTLCEMWYKTKLLYDKYSRFDRRNGEGQLELQAIMENSGYRQRIRDAFFLFQYYNFTKFYQAIFMNYKTTTPNTRTEAFSLNSYIPRESFVRRESSSSTSSSSASSSTSWDQAMRSLTQVVASTSTLPLVREEEDPDLGPEDAEENPDLGPDDVSDNPEEQTQSELETNTYQSEVHASEVTTSPEHAPDADAGAGIVLPPPPPPAGPPPDEPHVVILLPPPAVRPRRRWQLDMPGVQQTQEEQDEEFRRDRQEFLHPEGRVKAALDR